MNKIREKFTENAEQFDELMMEMLNENEELTRINMLWRHRMQAMIRRIRKDNSFYTQYEIDSWFDDEEYPKSS